MKIIKSRLFKTLVLLFIVGFFIGIVCYFILDNTPSSIDYLNMIKNHKINYNNILLNSIINNYKYSFLIWIIGIVFIFIIINPILIIFRGIITGYTLFSIIVSFRLKGLLLVLILSFPCIIINEIIFILLGYYSISFSFKLFNAFKDNKSINIKSFSLNYFYIFLILNTILLFSSLFETYVSSNIIKFVI